MEDERGPGRVADAEARVMGTLLVGSAWLVLGVLVATEHLREVPGAVAAFLAAAYVVRR